MTATATPLLRTVPGFTAAELFLTMLLVGLAASQAVIAYRVHQAATAQQAELASINEDWRIPTPSQIAARTGLG